MTTAFTESLVEEAALAWLRSAGWAIVHGPDIRLDGDCLLDARNGGLKVEVLRTG